MRLICWSALLALAGCDVFFPLTGPTQATDDAPPTDLDAPVDVLDAPACYGSELVKVCLDQPPTEPLLLDSRTIDTATDSLCVPHEAIDGSAGLDLCVLAGTSIQIDGPLRAFGSKLLVMVSATTIQINGSVIASSSATFSGPGAKDMFDADCPNVTVTAGPTAGGAGGSFGSKGGNGSKAGAGQAAPVSVPATKLRAGCRGGGGGTPSSGSFGRGGGAVGLIALDTIQVDGVIDASGSGGGGGTNAAGGGGGGGSGGMIFLEGTIMMGPNSEIFANGGGGGEGANMVGVPGCRGAEATNAFFGGAGGTEVGGTQCGSMNGDNGGVGAAGSMPGGIGVVQGDTSGGGGGGGGGLGVLHVFPDQPLRGTVSPPST